MQAIILAAGMGKRLGELTHNNTKCMVEVNGVTLIERMLNQLDSLKPDLSRIVIVIGHKGNRLKDYIATLNIDTEINYVVNKDYATTNNIFSLALAKDYLIEEDTLLLESDLLFEDGILEQLLCDSRPTLALVDKYRSWMDGTVAKIDSKDNILSFVTKNKFVFEDIHDYYKTVNIYKFSKEFSEFHYVPFLEAYSKAYGNNEYYEQVLRVLTMLDDSEVKAKRLKGQLWYEIDDIQDLDIAASMFNLKPKESLDKIHHRYGGYWRYPKLFDFCYLVNPYYPPQRLCDEMKANFDTLIVNYPSGANVNSLLAAKIFSVQKESILVGNGAAELIASLLKSIKTPIGMIKPTFDEYPNRCDQDTIEVFYPETEDFSYCAQDIIEYFGDKNIGSLILINPDNPSGNYLSAQELGKVMEWAKLKSINLILDESFSDFSSELDNSCLENSILQTYPNLIVIKSISKSFGVPGVRLGVLASSDDDLISSIKKDLTIWNINSFGEFFLQVAEKYSYDYQQGLALFRQERERFYTLLSSIRDIKVFPSQANYFMIELMNGNDIQYLSEILYKDWNILIKDLGEKILSNRQLARIAIRKSSENDIIICALKSILGQED